MSEELLLKILTHHLPEKAFGYCFSLWKEQPFNLKLSKNRKTKIGDFTCQNNTANPRITLNNDLNSYSFLITYIHEVAHLHVFMEFGHRVAPHGHHWKFTFQKLLAPTLTHEIFPEVILAQLIRHMQNPKASAHADVKLTRVLRTFDSNQPDKIALTDLPEGNTFHLHGRYFTKGKIRRTRILCKEIESKRLFLVPANALVNEVQLSLL